MPKMMTMMVMMMKMTTTILQIYFRQELKYSRNTISEFKRMWITFKLQTYNRINDLINTDFGKQMTTQTKLIMHNIACKATLRYGVKCYLKCRDNYWK
jgi:hypothetical protein